MKRTDQVTRRQGVRLSQGLRRLAAIMSVSNEVPQGVDPRQRSALGNVVFIGTLLIQFGLGMGINLFITIPQHHPGANASNFVVGWFVSVVWGIAHGGLLVTLHAVLGLLLVLSAISTIVGPLRFGLRGVAFANAAGAVCMLVAAINGAAFLTYQQNVNSFLMALGFGGALLCYTISLYLVGRPTQAKGADS
jgi:hypothetical protein